MVETVREAELGDFAPQLTMQNIDLLHEQEMEDVEQSFA